MTGAATIAACVVTMTCPDVARAQAPVALSSTSVPVAEASAPEPASRVHIDSDAPVDLNLQLGGAMGSGMTWGGSSFTYSAMSWRTVCTSPCDRVIDVNRGSFVLGNSPFTFSRRLDLAGRSGDVTIEVQRRGSVGLRIAGAVLLGLGIGGAIAGPVLMLLDDPGEPIFVAGAGMSVMGAVGLAGGIPMLVFGRAKGRVRVAPNSPAIDVRR